MSTREVCEQRPEVRVVRMVDRLVHHILVQAHVMPLHPPPAYQLAERPDLHAGEDEQGYPGAAVRGADGGGAADARARTDHGTDGLASISALRGDPGRQGRHGRDLVDTDRERHGREGQAQLDGAVAASWSPVAVLACSEPVWLHFTRSWLGWRAWGAGTSRDRQVKGWSPQRDYLRSSPQPRLCPTATRRWPACVSHPSQRSSAYEAAQRQRALVTGQTAHYGRNRRVAAPAGASLDRIYQGVKRFATRRTL